MNVDRIRNHLSENNEWIRILGQCPDVQKRYEMLFNIFPQLWRWSPAMKQELYLVLQKEYKLDFGIEFSTGGEPAFPKDVFFKIHSEKR